MIPEDGIALAEIPRLYTALAETGAVALFVLLLRRRCGWALTAAGLAAAAAVLIALHTWAGTWPLSLWVPGMLGAAGVMIGALLALTRTDVRGAVHVAARAFLLAELAASLHAQIERFYLPDAGAASRAALLIGVYGTVLAAAWLAERRHVVDGALPEVSWRELVSALAMAAAVFAVSNLSFLTANSPFSGRLGSEIAYIRTLVDLCGYVLLYMQLSERHAQAARRDQEAMAQLVRHQHAQYAASRRAMEEIDRKYHDMKHHLQAIRAEADPAARHDLLGRLETSIQEYGDQVRTGNAVLDVVLASASRRARDAGVETSFVADGALLDFLDPLDLTAIVGNALDNAIEAASALPEGRLVQLAVFSRGDFTMLRVRNTYDGVLRRRAGRIVTRKSGQGHGYGLRNIEEAAERRGGVVSIDADDDWFTLQVLFPRAPRG